MRTVPDGGFPARAAAAGLLVAALLGACAGPGAGAVPTLTGTAWTTCPARVAAAAAELPTDPFSAFEVRCTMLRVPLDHADPAGASLDVAVLRARRRGTTPVGSVVFVPGGPGQAGLPYAPMASTLFPDGVLERYELVTFDPRGTGATAPLDCPDVDESAWADEPADLSSDAGLAAALDLHERFAASCRSVLGAAAPFFSTEQTAHDLDAVRALLGREQLTVVGLSYGAKLTAEYVHLYPQRVRAAVVDAPSDPRLDFPGAVEAQASGFAIAFDAYARGCSARPTCARLGDPRRFAAAVVEQAYREPIPSVRREDAEPSGGGTVVNGILSALYDEARWPDLDTALYEARFGNSAALRVFASTGTDDDGGPSDADDVRYVVNCNDAAPGPDDAAARATAARMSAADPLLGRPLSFALLGCRPWQPRRSPLPLPTATTTVPVLVMGTTRDPATPYAGAVSMASALGRAVLLTRDGEGHTAFGRTACVREVSRAYLLELRLPPAGTRCVG